MFGMLSDEEIDALYAQMERPYSQEEVARFVRTPESRARRLLEETHYHNYNLIDLAGAWREYLAGTAPRPRDELARLLVPGRNAENAARDRLDALVDYFSAYPHGGVPRFPIFTFAMRSSFTLVAHLGDIHPTRHLDAARDSLRSFARLVAYCGEPTLRRDAFGESLRDAATSFLDACARNASELDIWLHTPPEEREVSVTARRASVPMPATKSDLRAAVKTILRGEDVNAAKPGPRLTPAKRRQIDAAETWRKSHAGCTLHNACIRSFVPARGGYRSADALYSHLHRRLKS